MAATKASLIIPVANQVRELDAKILLSCVAAQRGFSCIIGSWRELAFLLIMVSNGFVILSKG